ncbi:MAG TPA: histidine phosphatase family protein [Pyrinomonadaceae bacterium]|jgi:alpha-ribazole phosphatase|nr:histidine phosphatase family protein [Pyrinomonadaceae bacterium]
MSEANIQDRLRLYLIRHGEVEGAASGKLLGRTDTPLSERGIEQAVKLAEILSTAQLCAVYCSDLQRARVTAEVIAKLSDVKVQESSAWREIEMGQWEGRTMSSLHDEAPELVAQLFNDPASFEYPGGESFACFTARVLKAVDQLLMTHKSGEVVLVAHGGVCRAIIGNALGIPAKNWLRLAQDYGCLNMIDWYDGNPILQRLNLRYGGVLR